MTNLGKNYSGNIDLLTPESLKTRIRPGRLKDLDHPPPYESAFTHRTDGTRQEFLSTVDRKPSPAGRTKGCRLREGGRPDTGRNQDWAGRNAKGFLKPTRTSRRLEKRPAGILFGYWYWDWSESYHRIERSRTKTTGKSSNY